jgi:hypothetical protein
MLLSDYNTFKLASRRQTKVVFIEKIKKSYLISRLSINFDANL